MSKRKKTVTMMLWMMKSYRITMNKILKYLLISLLLSTYAQAKVGNCSMKELGRYSDEYYACLKEEAIKTDAIEDINFYAQHAATSGPKGKEVDREYMISWYEKSVAKGDAKAMVKIAEIYQYYKPKSQPQKAIEWYKKAAKLKYPDAMEQLSKLMQETYGYDSIDRYKESIEAGNDVYWNMRFLANYYMRLEKFKKTQEVYEEIMQRFPNEKGEMLFAIGNLYIKAWLNDKEKEIEYYRQSAALGNKQAMFNLGVYYGDLKDYQKAEEYFITSDNSRMVCFMYTEKVKDNDKALKCYQKQARSNNPEDLRALAYMYMDILKDYDKAIKWYKKAYELGDPVAARGAGYTYRDLLHDKEKGYYWYHKAADMGDDNARRYLHREGEL